MDRVLDKSELGTLLECQECGKPTYARSEIPSEPCRLPDGFTTGNARQIIYIRGMKVRLCANCRYSAKYERY